MSDIEKLASDVFNKARQKALDAGFSVVETDKDRVPACDSFLKKDYSVILCNLTEEEAQNFSSWLDGMGWDAFDDYCDIRGEKCPKIKNVETGPPRQIIFHMESDK